MDGGQWTVDSEGRWSMDSGDMTQQYVYIGGRVTGPVGRGVGDGDGDGDGVGPQHHRPPPVTGPAPPTVTPPEGIGRAT